MPKKSSGSIPNNNQSHSKKRNTLEEKLEELPIQLEEESKIKKEIPQQQKQILNHHSSVLIWKEDLNYGFDYAIYPNCKPGQQHIHSIALAKRIETENTFNQLEKWVKLANSVNKELWLINAEKEIVGKFKLCKNC